MEKGISYVDTDGAALQVSSLDVSVVHCTVYNINTLAAVSNIAQTVLFRFIMPDHILLSTQTWAIHQMLTPTFLFIPFDRILSS